MITIKNVTKSFEDIKAVDDLSIEMKEHSVYGLIGTNGAGKSTLLRMMAGVYKPDYGTILIDENPVWDNPQTKEKIFFISDNAYFFANSTPEEMERYYKSVYKDFNSELLHKYLDYFNLGKKRKIRTYSKGMKKQLSILLGICSRTKYLYCDETFDGLDPVMRQAIKSLLAEQMEERGLTPIITSHNLRELEDICDTVGILHKGGVILSGELEELKCEIHKVQCVFEDEAAREEVFSMLDVVKEEKRGSLSVLTIRGSREETEMVFHRVNTVFYEILELTLEEVFISETGVEGYDIKKILFG
ncbi:MAG: ABC transporter ATP-binding protein [Lachnospiraceae bacterium]|nr:ABC transporter ATP-binding protein [Lachnospiraceae bacterium]